MKIVVYTAITALVNPPAEPVERAGADFVLFSDRPRDGSGWEVRIVSQLFTDPRRNSRIPKILAHQYVGDYDYSIWIDSTCRLLAPARDLIDLLKKANVLLFRHPARDCVYEEAAICMTLGLDDPDVIAEQVAKYEREGHPRRGGLSCGGVIVRRHGARVEAFNDAWWSEYCRHSCRDQLSLSYVLRKLGIRTVLLGVFDNPGLASCERW